MKRSGIFRDLLSKDLKEKCHRCKFRLGSWSMQIHRLYVPQYSAYGEPLKTSVFNAALRRTPLFCTAAVDASNLSFPISCLPVSYCACLFIKSRTNEHNLLSACLIPGGSRNTPFHYSCGGFNTPTLCVVTKGIKADCNHLMRTTTPTLASGLLID